MSLDPALHQRIESLLSSHDVVLFMKGSPQAPRCGFSAKAAGILDGMVSGYHTVDVLADPEIREGIKVYGSWPTIPQLYVKGELVGGSDIIESMLNDGQLHQLFGLPAPDRTPPKLGISERAIEAIQNAMDDTEEGIGLHLSVDPRFNAQFQLKPIEGHEIVALAGPIKVYLDLASAPRAQGIEIDWVDGPRGSGLSIHNPNAPPPVGSIGVADMDRQARAGELTVIDVRNPGERAAASLPFPHEVLDEDSHDRLAALPKDRPLAFLCHHGMSSRGAAEHFRQLGFTRVLNVEGGIDRYAQDVDSSVPRY
ncbi:Grx4 family monothiol glutaredoxin [Pseudomarimonas salicorniae]|uniref:Grx4 family monothiol glutaredoxin n=1 Tax=Pseudomarimonas salicorniae TaxID=2933270 RepID=A0ABT0GIL0_9GAMM|nr:Grx4 family monothiol glutaredoxin [Lysobacter sp. CAU 1642]MCK7594386.1 Grx4 family monothiol glutaredoxin [Lysobacter sp. CAU 1642]